MSEHATTDLSPVRRGTEAAEGLRAISALRWNRMHLAEVVRQALDERRPSACRCRKTAAKR